MVFTIYRGTRTNGNDKIGCDEDYPNRPIQQDLTNYYIVEELQKDYGYPVDKLPYWKTLQNSELGGWSQTAWAAVSIANTGRTPEHLTKQHQSIAGKVGGKTIASRINTCPHCFKEIKGRVYHRWHGDNCKHRKA